MIFQTFIIFMLTVFDTCTDIGQFVTFGQWTNNIYINSSLSTTQQSWFVLSPIRTSLIDLKSCCVNFIYQKEDELHAENI